MLHQCCLLPSQKLNLTRYKISEDSFYLNTLKCKQLLQKFSTGPLNGSTLNLEKTVLEVQNIPIGSVKDELKLQHDN